MRNFCVAANKFVTDTVRQTIFIGLSGGVDSAVSAALLQRAGHRCVGVFLESWSTSFAPSHCEQATDRRDAARVAAHLNIPFLVLPCADLYRDRVLQYFLRELQMGRTPNPDAICNAEIKFHVFLESSLAAGADLIATGHYARILDTLHGPTLLRGIDPEKDQSYFLSRVPMPAFKSVRFPVGDLRKTEVRKLAHDFRLPNATKKDSQGLCFVGKIALPEFIQHFFSATPGPIVNQSGVEIGQHHGLPNYTIGQRHGFQTSIGKPQYVVEKNVRTNTLIVADSLVETAITNVPCTDWISHTPPNGNQNLTVKLRYRQPDQPLSRLTFQSNLAIMNFLTPQKAVTPGQIAVVYQQSTVIGSGILV